MKVDLLKSPIFQTTSTISGTLSLSSEVSIGKRGKPALLSVSNSSYLAVGTGCMDTSEVNSMEIQHQNQFRIRLSK